VAAPMTAPIPPGLDLTANYTLEWTALDPTTGAVDTSVVISAASLLVDNLGGGDLTTGFPDMEPLFTPVPVDLQTSP